MIQVCPVKKIIHLASQNNFMVLVIWKIIMGDILSQV